jgi:hypothetical protein
MSGPGNRYFAYGSNMDADQMTFRGLEVASWGAAILYDHRLAFDFQAGDRWLGGAADVVQEPGAIVEGILYHLVDPIEVMDPWEGVPDWYRRIPVSVELVASGEVVEAWTYEVVDKLPYVPPSEGYIGKMILAARKAGLSEGYIDGLRFHLAPRLEGLVDHVLVLRAIVSEGPSKPEELSLHLCWGPDRVQGPLNDLLSWGWVSIDGDAGCYRVDPARSSDVPGLLG